MGKWFGKRDKEPENSRQNSSWFNEKLREPEVHKPHRDHGNPPAGSDRDFVYHER